MDEFSFIKSIKPGFYRQSSLIKGINDDAAVIRPTGEDIVTAVDTMVEGVHFSKETMQPYHVGHRVLAANISDLAAMGSTPAFFMVSLTIPSSWNQEELEELYEGMKQLAHLYKMDLIGGDTVSGSELSVTVTVIGTVPKGKARYRSAAKPDDVLFVTGTLGDARAGLEWLLNGEPKVDEDVAYLVKRHRTPSPRVEFAQSLVSLSRLTLNDVSDGIANEANEIAEASDVDLLIDAGKLPFSKAVFRKHPERFEEWMFSGGEDFELLGTVSEEDWPLVEKAARNIGLPVTRIGEVAIKREVSPKVWIRRDEHMEVLGPSGYTHLKEKGE
ncbi:thiamine-monophosphate kinase [Halobacillus dabanensis]|uniref:Thiamine-monophosphate kinase n=1 Tax=Halobacillus dabanensis TaxID=240302 RepID=A0A1I3ZWR4_HALDA|nr:thiamine-phosphate kinase [Halobacillus dabanensis]SFK47989.1 thiamine-monophosphate kinase [Halobacillus dabanensis]